MALKIAFIFVAPKSDPKKHYAVVDTPLVIMTAVGVADRKAAADVARELVNEGDVALELSGGFGVEGTAAIMAGMKGKASVGVVRFENHA